MSTSKRRVIFLDRDGTINPQASYNTGPQPFVLIPGVAHALYKLKQLGFALVVVTNQGCVAYGCVTKETVDQVNAKMTRLITEEVQDVCLDAVYCSYHSPNAKLPEYYATNHPDVKPRPGLLLRAAQELNLDLTDCYMIGDRLTDMEVGKAVGATTILVQTGDGKLTWKRVVESANVCRDDNETDDRHKVDVCLLSMVEAAEWVTQREAQRTTTTTTTTTTAATTTTTTITTTATNEKEQ